jgi:hypothetical protein
VSKSGKKKGSEERPKRARSSGGVKPFRLGLLAAAVIAGPPLYGLVQDGSIDSVTALQKAGIVAMACAIGFSWLRGLIVDYQADVEITKRRKAARTQEVLRMIELENAAKAAEAAQAARSAKNGRRGTDQKPA